jgi:SHS2 domain-containing protein
MRSAAAGFSLHPHTADIRLQVWAPTLQELFCVAAQGLAEVLVPEGCRRPAAPLRRWYRFAVHSPDETALLVDFLSMVLLASYLRRALFCRVRFLEFTPTSLRARLMGYSVEGFQQDVKAVTYHEAQIRLSKQGYEAWLVLDV